MKKLLLNLFLILLLASCVDDVTNVSEIYPQQWELIRMTGPDDHFTRTGRYLKWQEFYLLNPDGRFLKSRLQDGVKTSVEGSFIVQEVDDETQLIFNFDEPSEIIGGCSASPQEILIRANSSLLIGTWQSCDGPLLEYFRAQ